MFKVICPLSAFFGKVGELVERRYSAFAHDHVLRIDGQEIAFFASEVEEMGAADNLDWTHDPVPFMTSRGPNDGSY